MTPFFPACLVVTGWWRHWWWRYFGSHLHSCHGLFSQTRHSLVQYYRLWRSHRQYTLECKQTSPLGGSTLGGLGFDSRHGTFEYVVFSFYVILYIDSLYLVELNVQLTDIVFDSFFLICLSCLLPHSHCWCPDWSLFE